MAAQLLPTGGIALVGAPDGDIAFNDARCTPVQAMQVDITQDIIDDLLENARGGKQPQIVFGRTPVRVHSHPFRTLHGACTLPAMARPCRRGHGGLRLGRRGQMQHDLS